MEIFFRKNIIEAKRYNTFAEALSDCNNEGYANSKLCTTVVKKTQNYKEQLQSKPFIVKPVQCYLILTLQKILLEANTSEITIVDFGGAAGAHYFETRRLISNNIKVNWKVVETGEMVKTAMNHHLHNNELNFFEEINNLHGEILYSSGSIQYVPDLSVLLPAPGGPVMPMTGMVDGGSDCKNSS
jgi:putative methyltransferase (TIGR04325 family)